MFNAFVSPDESRPATWLPSTPEGLPHPGPALFGISSRLPEPMAQNARSMGIPVAPGARGLLFNADMSRLVSFLQMGTHIGVRDR